MYTIQQHGDNDENDDGNNDNEGNNVKSVHTNLVINNDDQMLCNQIICSKIWMKSI